MTQDEFLSSDSRSLLIKRNIIYSLLIKGWSGLVILLLVPVTLACLGEYENGIWMTISSMLIWIDNMDIGLGNGLRNKLAEYIANNNVRKAKEVVSSTLLMLVIIIIPISILLLFVISYFDIYSLLNVSPNVTKNLSMVVAVATMFTCTTFIFKFIGNVYLALQLPAVNNLLITIGQTLSLICTVALFFIDCHSLLMIAIVNTCSPLVIYLLAYPITFYKIYPFLRPSLTFVRLSTIRELCGTSIIFFVLQISGIVLFFSSNIIISHLFSPAHVTPYQIAYRYFSIVLLIFTIIGTPYWSATTEAFARGDMEWIKTAQQKICKITILTTLVIFLMVLLSEMIYQIWIGDKVTISISVTIGMATYIIVVIWSLSYCYFLNGIGVLRLQLLCTIGAACLFIPLSCLIVKLYNNVSAVLFALTIVNIPSLIFNRLQFKRIMNESAKGLWKK